MTAPILHRLLFLIPFLSLPVCTLAQSPQFTSTPVVEGEVGVRYQYNITTSGWWFREREIVLAGGTLPNGLTLTDHGDGTGVLQGTPDEAGSFDIELRVNRVGNPSNGDTQAFTLTIDKKNADIVLSDMTTTYNGAVQKPTVTTSPNGLNVDLIFPSSSDQPINAGTYQVTATINDPSYQGSASGTFIIKKADASVALSNLNSTYDGSPKPVTVTTSPSGLNVDITYDGNATPPSAVGSYAVVATISDQNYDGSATGTLVIAQVTATITLHNLNTVYNGNPHQVTATTSPEGLEVKITYDGSTTAPVNVGNYEVKAEINDANFSGTAEGTLKIEKQQAEITLDGLQVVYDGSPKPVLVKTEPEGLDVKITYNGAESPPSAIGNYEVIVTIQEINYKGTANGTLLIIDPTVSGKPVLSNFEKDDLIYGAGEPGVPITQSVIINDSDDSHMQEAKVSISRNFVSGEDLLEYRNQLNVEIQGFFDSSTGVLTLLGDDTKSHYETALANVIYRNTGTVEDFLNKKAISIVISDGTYYSEPVSRNVNMVLFPEIDIVNAFTPNGDNVNDYWEFLNLDLYSVITISVYNSEGTRVFSCSGYDCKWDGTYNGKLLPAGAYYYKIVLDSGKKDYQGTVTILR